MQLLTLACANARQRPSRLDDSYMKSACRAAVWVVLASVSAHAQATLPERAKRPPESSGLMITRQISPVDLPELAAAAAMIVRVVVNSESPRLSENQLHIDTDYVDPAADLAGGRGQAPGPWPV